MAVTINGKVSLTLPLLTEVPVISTLKAMEVHFTPEQEAQLSRIADQNGTDTEQLVKDAALRLVEDVRFRASVRRGVEQANRGELLSHNDVKARIERLLQP
jgi:predicted transcriptional regulator